MEEVTPREQLLQWTKEAVAVRENAYGSPKENFHDIAKLWDAYKPGVGFSTADVALMMMLVKVARLKWDEFHVDSWVDIAGYAACGYEVVDGSV